MQQSAETDNEFKSTILCCHVSYFLNSKKTEGSSATPVN